MLVRNDVGSYDQAKLQGLSNDEKLWLLTNAYRPNSTHVFPQKEEYGKKPSFQHFWLVQFPWLCYSEAKNGGYCTHCVLFAKHHQPLG